MANASQVIVVPGHGLDVAQGPARCRRDGRIARRQGIEVKYAIHPVAGRMHGQMTVLLAEADVPYDQMKEMDDINAEFSRPAFTLVIGANDVTKPGGAHDPASPIYGMPILNVVESTSSSCSRGR